MCVCVRACVRACVYEGAFNCHVGDCIPCLFLTVPRDDLCLCHYLVILVVFRSDNRQFSVFQMGCPPVRGDNPRT